MVYMKPMYRVRFFLSRMEACAFAGALVLVFVSCGTDNRQNPPPVPAAPAVPPEQTAPSTFSATATPRALTAYVTGSDSQDAILAHAAWHDLDGPRDLIIGTVRSAGVVRAALFTDDTAVPVWTYDMPATARLHSTGIMVDDHDGDGSGEALFVWSAPDGDPGTPDELELVTVGKAASPQASPGSTGYPVTPMTIHGSTRVDTDDWRRLEAITIESPELAGASDGLKVAAWDLWNTARHDYLSPPPWPGFTDFYTWEGFTATGSSPSWALELWPRVARLRLFSKGVETAITYTAMNRTPDGLVVEGRGVLEGWEHTFRITIRRPAAQTPAQGTEQDTGYAPGVQQTGKQESGSQAPGLQQTGMQEAGSQTAGIPASCLVEWSDGSRLTGQETAR